MATQPWTGTGPGAGRRASRADVHLPLEVRDEGVLLHRHRAAWADGAARHAASHARLHAGVSAVHLRAAGHRHGTTGAHLARLQYSISVSRKTGPVAEPFPTTSVYHFGAAKLCTHTVRALIFRGFLRGVRCIRILWPPQGIRYAPKIPGACENSRSLDFFFFC